MKNIHIVNGNSAAGTLKYVLKENGDHKTTIVYCFNDMLSIGPLFNIESVREQQKRQKYLSELIHKIDDDYPLSIIINEISDFINFEFHDYNSVTIWHGNNTPERMLKFFCCKIIKNKKLYEIDLSKTKTLGRIHHSMGECSSESVGKLLNSSNKISEEDYIKSKDKWNKIILSDSNLRIFNKGNIENVPEDFYDSLILEKCTNEFTSAQRIVGEVLGVSDQLIGDTYISYRLLYLIEAKQLKFSGDLNNFRTLLVKN